MAVYTDLLQRFPTWSSLVVTKAFYSRDPMKGDAKPMLHGADRPHFVEVLLVTEWNSLRHDN